MKQTIFTSFRLLIAFTLLTGLLYPLAVTGLAQVLFPVQANGSVLRAGDVAVGSTLIGQGFTADKYLWSRPSATAPFAYNAAASTGSNLGPTNPALVEAVRQRVTALHKADPGQTGAVPTDLVTTSASGLDPHISVAAAAWQVARVARTRGVPAAEVQAAIAGCTHGPLLGMIGPAHVDVLCVNLALDHRTVHP